MAQQVINIGINPNDGTGEPLRGAWQKTNAMFTEQYALNSQTINAAAVAYDFSGATDEQRINLAVADATLLNADAVFIPASMLPFDITLITNLAAFHALGGRLTREGGDQSSYDVQAYGADRDGVLDSTANFQAWLDASPAGFISPGRYRCGLITDATVGRREIRGAVGAIIIPTAATWLKIVPPAAKFGVLLKGLTFEVSSAATVMTPIVWLEGSNAGGIVDVEIDSLDFGDLLNRSCDLLWLRACFNGKVENIYGVHASGCRGILYSSKDFNSGNISFDSITINDAAVSIQLGQAWQNANQQLLNQVSLINYKVVRSAPTTGCYNPVTLTAQATQGATTLTVSGGDATSVANAIAAGTPQWVMCAAPSLTGDTIKVLSASGTTITLAGAVPQTLVNGTIVPIGTFGVIILGNTRGVEMVNPQLESVGFGCVASACHAVTMHGCATATQSATIPQQTVYITNGASRITCIKPIYSLAAGSSSVLFHATAQGSPNNCDLIEPSAYSSGGGPTLFLNDAGAFNAHRFRRQWSGQSNGGITYAATVTPDESYDTNLLTVTNGSAFNFALPTNRAYGTIFTIDVSNASGGVSATPTFHADYKLSGAVAFTPPGNGTHRSITFRDDATALREIRRDTADIA